MQRILNLSVHDIVDVLLRKGHLDTRVFNQSSMMEGTRMHALYQKEQGTDYYPEYPLEYTFFNEGYVFVVSGKADGVIFKRNKTAMVEEIKTTISDLDEFYRDHGEWHLGQALFYAFMLSKQKSLSEVTVQLTYLKQGNDYKSKKIVKTYSSQELETFVQSLIVRYTEYIKKIDSFKNIRDESCKDLPFPFKQYRQGQKEIIDFVSEAAEEKKTVYLEAPTGIGKTVSTLYPLIRLFGEKKADLIFYLTSKNSIKKVAMNAIRLFLKEGAKAKAIEFTSQEALCFNDKVGHCNPDECPFARNYYDKLLEAIFDCLEESDFFGRKELSAFALDRQICPFQFQLDLSKYCDILVCDYSYVFDYHDRLGLKEGEFYRRNAYLLVDECHNLPDRVRDMYSIEITLAEFEDALPLCSGTQFLSLKADIEDSVSLMKKIPIDTEDENVAKEHIQILKAMPDKLLEKMSDILSDIKSILKKYPHLVTDPLLSFFYNINSFYYLAGLTNDDELGRTFLCYAREEEGKTVSLRIANLDSKPLIKESAELFQSACFFSATLSPKDYYVDLLGGDIHDSDDVLFLPSPFSKENRRVFVDCRYSLRYRDRDLTLKGVYEDIKACLNAKQGNYFIFCPSFQYLESLLDFFQRDQESLNVDLVVQERGMKDSDRETFLEKFSIDNEKTTVGLVVLGGVFSEGIDLVGDRLIGTIVISAGIPQIGFERNQLMAYYDSLDEEDQKGFAYSYTFPGLNKVLQASGRVIRSETDKGVILFIDSRFRQPVYQKVLKEIYPDLIPVISQSQLKMQLIRFWRNNQP